MKKKVFIILVVLFVIFNVASCGNDDKVDESYEDSIIDSSNDVDVNEPIDEIVEDEVVMDETVQEETSQIQTQVSGIRPEIKNALDSYENFFDEYVRFMNEYTNSENSFTMLAEYTKFMKQYAETMEKMSEIENQNLSDEETLYFLEVQTRINSKLLQLQ